jgi:hypothetical protein
MTEDKTEDLLNTKQLHADVWCWETLLLFWESRSEIVKIALICDSAYEMCKVLSTLL